MTGKEIEPGNEERAAAIALRCVRERKIKFVFNVLVIVLIVLCIVLCLIDLFLEIPLSIIYLVLAAALFLESLVFFLMADITKQSFQTLLCNECDLATYRLVMCRERELLPFSRHIIVYLLNSLFASITRGDFEEAHEIIDGLDEIYPRLKQKHQFTLDIRRWELATLEARDDEARYEQACKDLTTRWEKPPRGVDKNTIQSHLRSVEANHYITTGNWEVYGALLAAMPITSVFQECNYHWLRSQWCKGTGVSAVPDLVFVADHGGDMLAAVEARKILAKLPEEERSLSVEQRIPSRAPLVSFDYKRNHRVAIILGLVGFGYCCLAAITQFALG